MVGFRDFVSVLLLSTATSATEAPRVATNAGEVVGLSDGKVNKFLGIPFAQSPPVRFSAPVDPKSWSAPLQATAVKAACIQQISEPIANQIFFNAVFNHPAPPESEDCLYLNVWAPSKPAPAGGFPVMFWIYGGDLQFGTGSLPTYDGSVLAETRNVVVVTHNYRTNVFGFPNAPGLPKGEDNPGFLDQRKALDWVNKNIAKFGGDPAKVTIFGQSAGGYSVKQLIANPPKPLNFRAAIMESQAQSPKNGPEAWQKLAAALNCTSAAEQLECVRKVDAVAIKKILEHLALGFAPVNDDVTNSESIEANVKSGKAAKVPVIIGSTADDGSIFALTFSFTAQTDPTVKLTAPDRSTTESINSLEFQCPAALISNLLVENDYPGVWRYLFNASIPEQSPFPEAGAFHGIDIQPLFGNYREGQAGAWTQTSGIIQGGFTAFAADPAAGPGWDRQTKTVEPVGVININGLTQRPAEQFDGVCSSYDTLIEAQGL